MGPGGLRDRAPSPGQPLQEPSWRQLPPRGPAPVAGSCPAAHRGGARSCPEQGPAHPVAIWIPPSPPKGGTQLLLQDPFGFGGLVCPQSRCPFPTTALLRLHKEHGASADAGQKHRELAQNRAQPRPGAPSPPLPSPAQRGAARGSHSWVLGAQHHPRTRTRPNPLPCSRTELPHTSTV